MSPNRATVHLETVLGDKLVLGNGRFGLGSDLEMTIFRRAVRGVSTWLMDRELRRSWTSTWWSVSMTLAAGSCLDRRTSAKSSLRQAMCVRCVTGMTTCLLCHGDLIETLHHVDVQDRRNSRPSCERGVQAQLRDQVTRSALRLEREFIATLGSSHSPLFELPHRILVMRDAYLLPSARAPILAITT
jgi:hypothetical protein